MATFMKFEDPLVTCPYNPAHRVSKHKLQIHITKCRKNHPEVERKTCPFNAKHLLPPDDFANHLLNCPDRILIDRHIVRKDNASSSARNVEANVLFPDGEVPTIPMTGEDWDNEVSDGSVPGYDPYSANTKPIFRSLSGMKPAERRQYYKSLHSEPKDHIPGGPEQPSKPPEKPKKLLGDLKELRQPTSEFRKEKHTSETSDDSMNSPQGRIGRGRITVAEALKRGIGRGLIRDAAAQPVAPQGIGIGRSRAPEPCSLPPLPVGEVRDVESGVREND